MKRVSTSGAAAIIVMAAAPVFAHPGPRVWIGSSDGQIVTYAGNTSLSPTSYTSARVFVAGVDEDNEELLADGMLKEYPVPGTGTFATEFPGYQVRLDGNAGFGAGRNFGFDIAGPLLVYNDATHLFETTRKRFGTPGPAPQISLDAGSVAVTALGPVTGFNFLSYNTAGDHGHLRATLLGNGTNPVDGPQGVYAIPMKLKSSGLAPSSIYYVLYGRGIGILDYNPDYGIFQDAVDAAGATLTTTTDWPGQWWADADGNWSSTAKWMPDVPDVPDLPAQFLSRITAPRTVTVDGDFTVGSLVFNNANRYTLSGAGSLTLQMSAGATSIRATTGSHTVNVPITLANDAEINVQQPGGKLTLAGNFSAAGKAITKTGAGTVEVKHVRAASLDISAGTVAILPNGTNSATSTLTTLTRSPGTKLDLSDNKLILTSAAVGSWNGSSYTGITGEIQAGRNGGAWNGAGIVTSMPLALSHKTTLAVAAAGDVNKTTFGGISIGTNDVLIMYTWTGDADLSGAVDGADYFRIDTGFAGSLKGYINGDFDYNGRVDADDYFVIDRSYHAQGTPFSASFAAVPEPGFLSVICGVFLLARRRWRV